jgi:hypothetical protein
MCTLDLVSLGLVTRFLEHSQVVTTSNCNTLEITVTTAHKIKSISAC